MVGSTAGLGGAGGFGRFFLDIHLSSSSEPFRTIVSEIGLLLSVSFSALGWHLLAAETFAQPNEAQQM